MARTKIDADLDVQEGRLCLKVTLENPNWQDGVCVSVAMVFSVPVTKEDLEEKAAVLRDVAADVRDERGHELRRVLEREFQNNGFDLPPF